MSTEQENEKAYSDISDIIRKIDILIKDAEKIADQHGLSFAINLGTYYGKGYKDSDYDGEWVPSDICIYD